MAVTTRLTRGWTAGAVICLILLSLGTGALGAQPTARASTALSRAGSLPHPGRSNGLSGLSCPSRRSCWAVGAYTNRTGATLNQALRWNGTRWSVFPVPSPGGTARLDFNELAGISCVSPSDCWAVGNYANGPVALRSQALHWNGAQWSSVAVPGTASNYVSSLASVTCVSHSNCWAVGSYSIRIGSATLNQALHWNGRRWSVVATPDPGGTRPGESSALAGVSCALPRDCWAVGGYATSTQFILNQALHWNGARWMSKSIPTPGGSAGNEGRHLADVSCASPRDCWAVGDYDIRGGQATLNQALHWNGRTWSRVTTPDPGGTGFLDFNGLSGVSCASHRDCWAAGSYGPSGGGKPTRLNQALHWDGRRWSLVLTPDPDRSALPRNNLTSVRCTSSASCWAVGAFAARSGADLNQALHWNGTRWSLG